MKLKSFGCSFIWGSELHDVFENVSIGTGPVRPSMCTWPALIAKHLTLEYECFAQPGSGNLRILDAVLQQIVDPIPSIFVIGWSWIDRFDYQNGINDPWKQGWDTIRPDDYNKESVFYYKNLHSQYQDKLNSLVYINSALAALSNSHHKLLMTYQDSLLFETDWHFNSGIKFLQNQIKNSMIEFDGLTFLEWSRQQNFTIGKYLHPLEDAHRAAADYIIDHNLV